MSKRKLLTGIAVGLVSVPVVGYIAALRLRSLYRAQDHGDGSINAVAIFGGAEERVTSKAFTGGAVRAICGGVELDLTNAEIENSPATIEATVVCGGVMIKVPSEWRVALAPSVTMGGVEDIRDQNHPSAGSPPDLVITGKVVCGGLAVGDEKASLHERHATE